MADAAIPIYLHPAFWAAVSFLAVFLLTGFVLLDRPRKWWVLLAAAGASVILFDWFGLLGFTSALGLKLWRQTQVLKSNVSRGKKKTA
ncbi:hypothetical protein HYV43_03240 [Candidatus Micrarchaeota archaeon]|nr:hypothetical protein [Candidatus Micrarchaeota archaeon]